MAKGGNKCGPLTFLVCAKFYHSVQTAWHWGALFSDPNTDLKHAALRDICVLDRPNPLGSKLGIV